MVGRIPGAYWEKKMYGYELSVGQEGRTVWLTKKKTLRSGLPNGLRQMPRAKRKSEEKEVLRQRENLLSMSARRS